MAQVSDARWMTMDLRYLCFHNSVVMLFGRFILLSRLCYCVIVSDSCKTPGQAVDTVSEHSLFSFWAQIPTLWWRSITHFLFSHLQCMSLEKIRTCWKPSSAETTGKRTHREKVSPFSSQELFVVDQNVQVSVLCVPSWWLSGILATLEHFVFLVLCASL